tara:strand:+ start:410 stop:730 length:321 start_codon:yes stop_codon:yes gene_type:complete
VLYRESLHSFEEGDGALFLFLNVMSQWAIVQFLNEFVEFFGVAHDLKFDAAVGEVSHPAEYIKAFGKVLGGVAKPDPLDPTREIILTCSHSDILSEEVALLPLLFC